MLSFASAVLGFGSYPEPDAAEWASPSLPPPPPWVSSIVSVGSDSYPSEVSWSLSCTSVEGPTYLSGGSSYYETHSAPLGSDCSLSLVDSFGDGWQGAEWAAPGWVDETFSISSGSSFQASFTIGDGAVAPLPPPPPPLTPPPPIPPASPPDPPAPPQTPCTGHTGDLAALYSFASYFALGSIGCESVAPGYDPTAPWSCDLPDGTDNILVLRSGAGIFFAGFEYEINIKDVCPETCGVPCAHAPTEDADDDFMMSFFGDSRLYGLSCADLAANGYCEWTAAGHLAGGYINWMCGASCGGYDECSLPSGFEFATSYCPDYVGTYYATLEACETDALNYVSETLEDYPCIKENDPVGATCDLGPAAKGSTEIYNCPS